MSHQVPHSVPSEAEALAALSALCGDQVEVLKDPLWSKKNKLNYAFDIVIEADNEDGQLTELLN